jgi:hypothetical protein
MEMLILINRSCDNYFDSASLAVVAAITSASLAIYVSAQLLFCAAALKADLYYEHLTISCVRVRKSDGYLVSI